MGRSADNDLVLNDPAKLISRVHAKVAFRAGSYFLEDVGSNPSVVNDQPLGKGKEIAIGHGDRIVIGDYQLEVRLEAVQPEPAYIAASPFNNPALPLFEPPPPVKATPLLPLPESVEISGPATIPAAVHDALAHAAILDVMVGSSSKLAADVSFGAEVYDPLGLNLFGSGVPVPALAPAFGPVALPQIAPDFAALLMPMPSPVLRAANLAIPDDYDPLADFFAPPALMPALPPVHSSAPLAQVLPLLPTLVPPVVPAFVSIPHALMADIPAYDGHAIQATQAIHTVASTVSLALIPQPSQPTEGYAASDSDILQALLRGLGLPDLKLKGSAPLLAETVGAMLREATSGTMDLLMARTLTKKESRVDMTMISVRSNNPLKFFPNVESAMTQLLTNAMAGYLPAVPAMEGAFVDLKAHELAVMAGMRAALAAVLHRFDPAQIEQHMALPTVMDKMLSANRKARMWDRLVEVYGEIVSDADDDLQRLFGEQFSAAYEAQVERLRPPKI